MSPGPSHTCAHMEERVGEGSGGRGDPRSGMRGDITYL